MPPHPLNDKGETIASLSKAGASENQIEAALRNWLVKTIARVKDQLQPRAGDSFWLR